MKVLIIRFMTLFALVAGFSATLPTTAHAIHFGPIPADQEGEETEDERPDEEPKE